MSQGLIERVLVDGRSIIRGPYSPGVPPLYLIDVTGFSFHSFGSNPSAPAAL